MGRERLEAGARESSILNEACLGDAFHCGVDSAQGKVRCCRDLSLAGARSLSEGVENGEGFFVEHDAPLKMFEIFTIDMEIEQ